MVEGSRGVQRQTTWKGKLRDAIAVSAKMRRAAKKGKPLVRPSGRGSQAGGYNLGVFRMLQSSAIAFHKADADGDHKLDFNEFKMFFPESIRSQYQESTIRELFDGCDLDHDGLVTRDEFFFWTLLWCFFPVKKFI